MQQQPKYKPEVQSDFFADGQADRPPVPDTVARGQAQTDGYYYTGKVNGTPVAAFPAPVTREMIERGQERSFSPRGASVPMLKLLRSAGANAENNNDLDPEDMRISSISVDEGPTMRRYRPRARGRATRIEKRSCHINMTLTPIPDAD